MTGKLPSSIVAGIDFVGRGGGAVKALGGFRKGRHTVPDAANAVTNAFLGKVCAGELTVEAEKLFQAVRTGLGYRRKEVALSVASPAAVLTAKDFVVELLYALEAAAPARFAVTTTLRELRNAELARTGEFAAIFAGRFSEISFLLKRGARVEAVIDAIEALNGDGGLVVSYPSNCRECEIGVAEVDARVRCTSDRLEVIFPRAGAPGELMEAFATVRGAFAISKVLAGLIA
jgi:hypothetical protein